MIAPGHDAPGAPPFALRSALVGRNLMNVIAEGDAAVGIKWAEQAIADGTAEEYALSATSLEDAYIDLTSHHSGGADLGGTGG